MDGRSGRRPAIAPVKKAAIVLVSLDQSLAPQLLSHLDRAAVEAVTWEIARLDRVEPADRTAVLEEFYGWGFTGFASFLTTWSRWPMAISSRLFTKKISRAGRLLWQVLRPGPGQGAGGAGRDAG